MNLWPWAAYTGVTIERQRSWKRNWCLRQLAADPTLCHGCYSRPAGSDGGSKNLCGTCRRDRLDRYRNRYKPRNVPPPVIEISHHAKEAARSRKRVELAEMVKRPVNSQRDGGAELSSGRSNC